jgi:tetratricopeptide (TPR) repeat protein
MKEEKGISRRIKQLALVLAALLAAGSASAADDREARYQAALDAMLENIHDPEANYEFALVAREVGDYRGAAAALDRILRMKPQLANIHLQQALLYRSMRNTGATEYHLREALRARDMPTAERAAAERMLAEVGLVGRRNTFRWNASLGVRRDSNANAGPDADTIWVWDPYILQRVDVDASGARGVKDTAFEGSLGLSHSFSFGDRRGSSWDTHLYAYGVRYDKLGGLDQIGYGVESGPILVFGGGINTPTSLRVFGSASTATLDSEDYFDQAGGGLELQRVWTPSTLTRLRVSLDDRDYKDLLNDLGHPVRILGDRSGNYLSARLLQAWRVGRSNLSVQALGQEVDAREDYQSYQQFGGEVGWSFPLTRGVGGPLVILQLSAGYRNSRYDAPDPTITDSRRKDERVEGGVGLEFAFSRLWSVVLEGGYQDNKSNIPNYSFDNVSAGLRARMKF